MNHVDPEIVNSYSKPIISFDIDWANDDVLCDTIEIIEDAEIKATWFVTHETKHLSNILKNKNYKVGVHPNFNTLLDGSKQHGNNKEEVIDSLIDIVPNAKLVRSHSVVQSSRLSNLFLDKGFTHESNDYIPYDSDIDLKPWSLDNGLIKVPYFWSDELECAPNSKKQKMSDLVLLPGLKVFDFHPIHIFLNTESLDRYEKTRHLHNKPSELIKYRYDGYGTRNRLLELINLVKKQ